MSCASGLACWCVVQDTKASCIGAQVGNLRAVADEDGDAVDGRLYVQHTPTGKEFTAPQAGPTTRGQIDRPLVHTGPDHRRDQQVV